MHLRILLAAAVALTASAVGLVQPEPSAAAGPGQYSAPEWLPVRSTTVVGCARSSGGPVCAGHHSYWALDLLADTNVAIYAAGAGKARVIVSSATCNGPHGSGGLGRHVIIDHGGGVTSVYAHLHATTVATGDWVDPTTRIGTMGKTGRSTCNANHLHYEKRVHGTRVDPGPLRACHGSRAVSYPSVNGRSTWDRYPGHSTQARSDGLGCVAGAATGPPTRFLDVPRATWYHDPVEWMASRGVTTGCLAAAYCPLDDLTRAQMATFLWRLAGSPRPSGAQFVDVPEASYAASATRWMRAEGLSTGVGGTSRFEPNRSVTRAEQVTMLHRFAGRPPASGGTAFYDVPRGAYYEAAVRWASTHGITTGVGGSNVFAPDTEVTRAESAAFISRYAAARKAARGPGHQAIRV